MTGDAVRLGQRSRSASRGQLGHYRPGSHVVLGAWISTSDSRGSLAMVVPRDWRGGWWAPATHVVIGNYMLTTGVVVLENQRTGARSELDWQTPVIVDWSRSS